MARRAWCLALLTAITVALAVPWALAPDATTCRPDATCVSAVDDATVPCVVDDGCAATVATAAVALLAVVAASPVLPALAAGRSRAGDPVAPRGRLDARRLLRPPQPALPS